MTNAMVKKLTNEVRKYFSTCSSDEDCKKVTIAFWLKQAKPQNTAKILKELWNKLIDQKKINESNHVAMLLSEYMNTCEMAKAMFIKGK